MGQTPRQEIVQDDEEDKNWKGIIIALLVILAIWGLVGSAIFIVSLKNSGAGVGEPFTLDDLLSENFKVKPVVGSWRGDVFVHRSSTSGDVIEVNPSNNQSTVIFPDNLMKSLEKDHFEVSPDFQFILVSSSPEKLPSGQRLAKYELFNRSNGSRPASIAFPGGNADDWPSGKLSHASWAPSGSALVFIHNNNIFFQANPYAVPSRLTDVTNPPDDDLIVAMPDFLYAEEILKEPVGYWLSPDLKTLAYIRVNQSAVPKHSIPMPQVPNQIYPALKYVPYPKAGDTRPGINPTVQLFLAETNNPKMSHLHIQPPSLLAHQEHYITLVKWLDYRRLLVVWSNRLQTMSVFTVCVTSSEECKTSFVEKQHKNTGWVLVNDVMVIKGGDFYLTLLPQSVGQSSSFLHIVLLSSSTETDGHKQYLTYGMFDVTEVVAFTEENNHLFYIATNGDPRTRHLFRLRLPKDLMQITKPFKQELHYTSYLPPSSSSSSSFSSSYSPITCLSCSSSCKYISATFSSSGKHYMETCLGPDVPKSVIKTIIRRTRRGDRGQSSGGSSSSSNDSGKASDSKNDVDDDEDDVKITTGETIEDNEKLKELVAKKALPAKHHVKYKAEDGSEILGQFFTPPPSGKDSFYRFPLLIYVNAAPGTQSVDERFRLDFTTFMTSSEGVMVASFDGRGAGGRGVKNVHEVYKHMGALDLDDLLRGIEHMKLHENINMNRIAVWGQAYGGFLASHVMGLKGNHSINCGIAISPITDFKLHDTAYTERHMGRPTSEDNYRGYDNANVLRKAKNFRNKKFLLVHGMADEKVHFQHSAMLASSLVSEQVLFYQMFYPSSAHDLFQSPLTKLHLYATMLEFLRYECWSDKEPDPRLKGPLKKFKH